MNGYLPKIVIRNLLRHGARSWSALLAIVFGVIALLIASGFIDWIYWAMRESTIESRLGHIQVMKPAYLEHGAADPFDYLLPESSPVLNALKALPGIEVVTPRLSFTGLISHGDSTLSFLGEGVKPDSEARVSKQMRIINGAELSAADAKEVLLGEGLAKGLGVRPGESVVLLATTSSGGPNAVELRVQGIFQTYTKAYDDVALRIPIEIARGLVRVSGSHVWVVLLDNTDNTHTVLNDLRARFPEASTGLQFVPWYDQADFYNKTVRLFSKQVNVVWVLIAVVVALSISNTMIMSVMERTREIGTLLALGFRRGNILRQFIAEGLVLGMVGGGVGLIVGAGLARLISIVGIPMPPPPGMGVAFIGKVAISWSLAGEALLFALVISVLASVYPAWKASRLEIVDALRHSN
jgi:putative ABC transport system permease protein